MPSAPTFSSGGRKRGAVDFDLDCLVRCEKFRRQVRLHRRSSNEAKDPFIVGLTCASCDRF
jgi:hypothetical protein